jgi:hypothetical protein
MEHARQVFPTKKMCGSMNVIGHDAPRDETISFRVEEMQRFANDRCHFAFGQKAFSMTTIQPVLALTEECALELEPLPIGNLISMNFSKLAPNLVQPIDRLGR